MNSTIRWGIIGCGDVTEVKSGPAFSKVGGSRLVAVMRRDRAKAQDYAQRHGVGFFTSDADELIGHPEVDAVYVATPPGSHREYALRVAAAGKPCYVEKPMARTWGECREMTQAFERAGRKLFVAYYRRMLPRFVQAKRLIDDRALGRITGVSYRYSSAAHRNKIGWRVDCREAGGGLFVDLGSHLLDLLDHLLGPLGDVKGSAHNVERSTDVEDAVTMSFTVPGGEGGEGAAGVASWNFASDQSADAIAIDGTDGGLRMSCFGNEPIELWRGKTVERFDLPNPPHVQQPLIATVVDDLLGRGTCPSTGASAARTSKVMDDVLAGYYGDRSEGFWDRVMQWPGRKRR